MDDKIKQTQNENKQDDEPKIVDEPKENEKRKEKNNNNNNQMKTAKLTVFSCSVVQLCTEW